MSEVISRRRLLGLLGVAVIALAAPVVISEGAEAQTVGMERRQRRRMGRRLESAHGGPPGRDCPETRL